MALGEFLQSRLAPILDQRLSTELDAKAHARDRAMKAPYRLDPD